MNPSFSKIFGTHLPLYPRFPQAMQHAHTYYGSAAHAFDLAEQREREKQVEIADSFLNIEPLPKALSPPLISMDMDTKYTGGLFVCQNGGRLFKSRIEDQTVRFYEKPERVTLNGQRYARMTMLHMESVYTRISREEDGDTMMIGEEMLAGTPCNLYKRRGNMFCVKRMFLVAMELNLSQKMHCLIGDEKNHVLILQDRRTSMEKTGELAVQTYQEWDKEIEQSGYYVMKDSDIYYNLWNTFHRSWINETVVELEYSTRDGC